MDEKYYMELRQTMLDIEKIRWMIQRCHLDNPFWLDDEMEIYEKLSKDMYETMDFLKNCTTEELEILDWTIMNLITDFEDEGNLDEYINFLEELGKRKTDSLLESVRLWKEERKLGQMDNEEVYI
jgi:hypothetical protein